MITKEHLESLITVKMITGDTAFKEKDSADWSVFQCWGMVGISGIALMDQIRGRWTFPDLMSNCAAFCDKHSKRERGVTPVTELWIEDKASGTSLVQMMVREAKIKSSIRIRAWLPKKKTSPDKVGRGKTCTMAISSGRVIIPNPKQNGYNWVKSFVNEHSSFSADMSHLFDDMVDAETMAVLIWMERGGGVGPLPVWVEG